MRMNGINLLKIFNVEMRQFEDTYHDDHDDHDGHD